MTIRGCLILIAMMVLGAFAAASCQKPGVQAGREDKDLTEQQVVSIDDGMFLLAAEKAEVKQTTLAQAALDRSKNNDVRDYAQQVINRYRHPLDELSDLIKKKNIPHTPARTEAIQLEAKDRLQGLSGSAFDREFVSLMTAEQQAALNAFNSAAETAADPDIRNYAKGIVPLLREDVDTAIGLEKKLSAP